MTDRQAHDPFAPLPRGRTDDKGEQKVEPEPVSVTASPAEVTTTAPEPAKKTTAPRKVTAAKKAPSKKVAARKAAAAKKTS